MDKINEIEPVAVLHIPKCLKSGKLYVSDYDGQAVHLCACGCGFAVRTPLREGGWWFLTDAEGKIVLRPSTLGLELPCGSIYCITHNRIEWLTREEALQCNTTTDSARRAKEEEIHTASDASR